MMKFFVGLLFVASIEMSPFVNSTMQAPDVMKRAIYCIINSNGGWLLPPLDQAPTLQVGMIRDTESFPHEVRIIVVVFENSKKGQVFDLQDDSDHGLTIVNNGRFVIESQQVRFVEAPLGGEWTQDRLKKAIIRMRNRTKYRIPRVVLKEKPTNLVCHSYADKQK